MAKTKIEWTDESWNPVTGCTKVSEGCRNCYAERMAKRLAGRFGYPKDDPFRVTLHSERLQEPLHWKKPRMVFVCSMSDFFHEDVPFWFIDNVMAVIYLFQDHIFQILTKRIKRAKKYFDEVIDSKRYVCDSAETTTGSSAFGLAIAKKMKDEKLPKNLRLGVSGEDQKTADERIAVLSQIPAAVRFVSMEPLLERIDIESHIAKNINWVIVGGESGPGARPIHPDWVRSVRDQCVEAGVPKFVKQLGTVWAKENGVYRHDPNGANMDYWDAGLRVREYPK